MGLNFLGSSSNCSCISQKETTNKVVEAAKRAYKRAVKNLVKGNPNAKNFQVIKTEQIGTWLIAIILYPDCENYDGEKIMVFHDITEEELKELDFLDPHFCENEEHISPIARFEPTPLGWNMAVSLCQALIHDIV